MAGQNSQTARKRAGTDNKRVMTDNKIERVEQVENGWKQGTGI